MDELNNALEHLSVGVNFDLAGHSWGGVLAPHYVGHGHPPLQHLVLASVPINEPQYTHMPLLLPQLAMARGAVMYPPL